MRRRQVLRKGGIAALGITTLASSGGAADPGRREPPNENAPSASVHPFGSEEPQQVSTGEWITHRIGWTSPTEAQVEDTVAKSDIQAWIDGEPVPEFDSYRGEIYEEDGDWYTFWRYTTPPQSPGTYDFRVRIEFTEDLEDGSREAGDVIRVTGTYEVSAGDGRDNGKQR